MKESHARANCLSRRENVETRNFAMHTREFTMGGNKFCSYKNQVLPQQKGWLSQGLLNRWTSQLDLGCTTGGLERVVSVHSST